MAVVVLMYHHTPEAADGFYDVALSTFRDQIRAMLDGGVSFVKFTELDRPEYIERGRHVALTFDDGHASDAAAFEFLDDCGLTPMAFIVRDWSQNDPRYLSSAALADLKDVCEFGGHGATHRALSSLTPSELADELSASRDYVGAIAGSPVAMALPGGHGNGREYEAATAHGFKLVGNSRPLPHARLGVAVNRICVNRTHDARAPLQWTQASPLYWQAKRARFAATAAARRLMGGRLYGALTALAK